MSEKHCDNSECPVHIRQDRTSYDREGWLVAAVTYVGDKLVLTKQSPLTEGVNGILLAMSGREADEWATAIFELGSDAASLAESEKVIDPEESTVFFETHGEMDEDYAKVGAVKFHEAIVDALKAEALNLSPLNGEALRAILDDSTREIPYEN